MSINPLHHSALVLEWNGHTIFMDPQDGVERFKVYAAPDLIVITDIHDDHMDPKTLRSLDPEKARIIAQQAVIDHLPEDLKKRCTTLAKGASTEVSGMGIEAIAMYNMPEPHRSSTYKRARQWHRSHLRRRTHLHRGRYRGQSQNARLTENIDFGFVRMDLLYTMTVDQEASGVLAFNPKVVHPYHYRDTEGLSDMARSKQLVNEGDNVIVVRLADRYAQ